MRHPKRPSRAGRPVPGKNGPPLAIGVDLGGTKIAAGVFDDAGKLHGELATAATEASGPSDRTVANLLDAIERALGGAGCGRDDVRGIGVGSTGPLDPRSGKLLEAQSLPNLYYFPLGNVIQARFELPVFMTNDGNAFALAEALFGAGKGAGLVVGVTIGTGCGCGVVIHGRILEGATANTGEVYRAPVAGKTFDDVLSGSGLERLFEERSSRKLAGREITRLADGGDPLAREVFAAFGRQIAPGVGLIAAVLDPAVMVLGGSVAEAFHHFDGGLREALPRFVAPQVAASLRLVPAQLGGLAGALGAAALVFSKETIH